MAAKHGKKHTRTRDNISEREMLIDMYVKQKMPAEAIADLLDWSRATVWNRLAFHGITGEHKPPEYCHACGHVVD